MKAKILRRPSTDEGTLGLFTLIELARWWPCLELPWRGNKRGVSCITAGTYSAKPVDSPHFHRKIYQLDTSAIERQVVELHNANFAGDVLKGWDAQLHGCICPGLKSGRLENSAGKWQLAVLSSHDALDEIMAATKGEPLEIEIAWEPGAEPKETP